jgi:hypothetical protein
MRQHLIETTECALAETGRGLRAMEDAKQENEMMIALSKMALHESLEVLYNASVALAGPYFRD